MWSKFQHSVAACLPDRPAISGTTVATTPTTTTTHKSRNSARSLASVSLNFDQSSSGEIERQFKLLVDELDLPKEKREKLLKETSREKMGMMVQEKIVLQDTKLNDPSPYIRLLGDVNAMLSKSNLNFSDTSNKSTKPHSINNMFDRMATMRVSLRAQSHSYIDRFLAQGGGDLLTALLKTSTQRRGNEVLAVHALNCYRILLNSTHGRHYVFGNSRAMRTLVMASDVTDTKAKILAWELLSGICLIRDGHSKVLNAAAKTHQMRGERVRFQHLLDDLNANYETPRDSVKVKVAIMSFVNALLKYGGAEDSLLTRIQLRNELLLLGMQQVVAQLRQIDNQQLTDHLDLFEMVYSMQPRNYPVICLQC